MRINELCESVDIDLGKKEKDPNDPYGLGFDLKDDLIFFMHHDDDAYRRHTFPTILKIKDQLDAFLAEDAKFTAGNAAAGTRARKALGELSKSVKTRRNEITAEKNARKEAKTAT